MASDGYSLGIWFPAFYAIDKCLKKLFFKLHFTHEKMSYDERKTHKYLGNKFICTQITQMEEL